MDRIAVLIPCYNESKTVGKVVAAYKKALPEAVIYVYDNNSDDDTACIAARAGAVVRHEYKRGKGNVVRRMFREVDACCYLMVDGDDTYPAEFAADMADKVLNKNVDMVVGDRLSSTYFAENKRHFHYFGNILMRRTVNLLFGGDVRDVMTGYRAFSYTFVKTFPVTSCGFEIETEMTIHAINRSMNITNVVVNYRDRPEGSESKLNTYTDGFRVFKSIFSFYKSYKPRAFFTAVSLVLALISLGLFIPVMLDYHKTGRVYKIPASVVLGTASVQSFFYGMLLDNIAKKNRQDFELKLIEAARHMKNEMKMNY